MKAVAQMLAAEPATWVIRIYPEENPGPYAKYEGTCLLQREPDGQAHLFAIVHPKYGKAVRRAIVDVVKELGFQSPAKAERRDGDYGYREVEIDW